MNREIATLSASELLALFEALGTIKDVTNALMNRKIFTGPKGTLNAAGEILDGITRDVGILSDQISDRARHLPVSSDQERWDRVELLLRSETPLRECDLAEAERAFGLIDSERSDDPPDA